MKHLIFKTIVLFALVIVSAFPALALSLDEAKARGFLGEKGDGYLGVVTSNAEAEALMNQINSQRRAEYQNIAQRNGTDVKTVELLAGKKAIEKTPAGQFVQSTTGGWTKK